MSLEVSYSKASWLKRYVLSCLIAVFLLGALDVTLAVVLGYTAGEIARKDDQG